MTVAGGIAVESLDAGALRRDRDALSALLVDAVESGASVGFQPPHALRDAGSYWDGVARAIDAGTRVVLVARDVDRVIIGTAQLELPAMPNAAHRAEVMKVIVHTSARRHGVGRILMLALEARARERGRTTLVLDTRLGDASERLYEALGYRLAGVVPRYARSGDGAFDATAFYYRLLE